MKKQLKFNAGEWVVVRSKEEILATLDKDGRLEEMPFMPQMFQFCGKRLKVFKRAHKTCDTVFPVRGRRVTDTVHLDTRCDGEAYGGCQAGCLLFWKEAWLKRDRESSKLTPVSNGSGRGCTEEDVLKGTKKTMPDGKPTYVCQATQLPYFTHDLSPWDFRQYIEDYTSGNITLRALIKGSVYAGYYNLSVAGIGLGPSLRWFYNKFHFLWNGTLFPRSRGTITSGAATPTLPKPLNLQPRELVRVKSHEEILKTLTTENKNRGLYFDAEMVPFCGKVYRVLKRVNKILDEKTGAMMHMKNECIILENVYCQSKYSYCRMFCPRAIYPYWREIWLERVEAPEVESLSPCFEDACTPTDRVEAILK